jgi:hypothetical protein
LVKSYRLNAVAPSQPRPRRDTSYYRYTKSKGGAHTCRQPYIREETLHEQVTEQIRAIQLDDEEFSILREILKESHADEQRYGSTA